jgi:hypothetical protein
VATLVASGFGPEPVSRAVADEVQALFAREIAAIVKFEGNGTVSVKGDLGGPRATGARVRLYPDDGFATSKQDGAAPQSWSCISPRPGFGAGAAISDASRSAPRPAARVNEGYARGGAGACVQGGR